MNPDEECRFWMDKMNEVHNHECVIEVLPNGEKYCADCMRKELYAMNWAAAAKKVLRP